MQIKGTLYITDHRAVVRIRRGTVLVEQPNHWQRVPIEALEGVIIASRAQITNDALGELVRHGIRVAALSRTGRLRFSVGGPTSGNVHLRLAQLRASDDATLTSQLCRAIMGGKLQNCLRAVRRWSWDVTGGERAMLEREAERISDRIAYLGSAADGDAIRGTEGDATRSYFRCLALHLDRGDALFSFERRSRRPPGDPVNALLSFTYGLVLAEVLGAVEAAGLDPQIGFLHRPRSGRPSLALDLFEELRPSVADRFCTAALARGQVQAEHFERVGRACYLTDAGRATLLALYEEYRGGEVVHPLLDRRIGRWMIPTIQATLMARHLRGDVPAYAPYVS